MRPLRILHCIEAIYSGGVERRRLQLVENLDKSTFEQRVICTEAEGPIAEAILAAGVPIYEMGPVTSIFDPLRYIRAASIMKDWQPDIVHGAVFEGYTLASISGRIARVPHVVLEETSDPQTRRWKGHLLCRTLAALADECVAVSPAVARYLTNTIYVPESKVTVIPNGVPRPPALAPEKAEALRRAYEITPDEFVIGSVGRMVDDSTKRFSDLIRATRHLRDRGTLAKTLLVGDGPARPHLEQIAADEGVADTVIFAGFQERVADFYGLMHVFVLASAHEAFGLVIAEAMRCGLPVVATSVGGIPNIVVHGHTGLLVPPKSPAALARAIQTLLLDEEERKRLGANGKMRADKLFSSERYVADVANFYLRLAGRSAAD